MLVNDLQAYSDGILCSELQCTAFISGKGSPDHDFASPKLHLVDSFIISSIPSLVRLPVGTIEPPLLFAGKYYMKLRTVLLLEL